MKTLFIIFLLGYMNTYSADWRFIMKPVNINNYFAFSSLDSSIFLFANDDMNITIYQSKDDGNSWPKILVIPKVPVFNYNTSTVQALDENNLFFPIELNHQINRFTLEPYSWLASKINSESTIDKIKMIDYDRGIAGNSSQIFRTKDSWINYTTIKVSDMQCLWYGKDESIAYVSNSGSAEYHKSKDNGVSWDSVSLGTFTANRMHFIDGDIGIVIGNVVDTSSSPAIYEDIIYRTSDGGGSWSEVLNSTRNERSELNDIVFINSKLGIATGTSNSIYTTNDAGLTWRKQYVEPLYGTLTRNTHCGYTKTKFIISVDWLGLYSIDFKLMK